MRDAVKSWDPGSYSGPLGSCTLGQDVLGEAQQAL